MLSDTPFYNATIRNTTIALATLFNNIHITRPKNDNTTKNIKVPIAIAPKRKWYARIRQDSSITDGIRKSTILPRMGLDMVSVQYDHTRKLNTLQKHRRPKAGDGGRVYTTYQRVPYRIDFSLYIAANRMEDSLKILEQILPYFTPSFTVTVEDQSQLETKTDVPFVLNGSPEYDNEYSGGIDEDQLIAWTLNFSAPVYFYQPVSESKIIRKVIVNQYSSLASDAAREYRVTVEPDPITAGPQDSYTFSVTENFFDDGKIFDADTGTDVTEQSSSSSSLSSSSDITSSSSSSVSTNSSSSSS